MLLISIAESNTNTSCDLPHNKQNRDSHSRRHSFFWGLSQTIYGFNLH